MKGLYIHIPFCVRKCNYCDFCSYPSQADKMDDYCRALCREASEFSDKKFKIDTVYFGGGTPTVFSDKNLALTVESIHQNFDISPDAEITIEANPGTVGDERAKFISSLGFNRVSIGAQSFLNSELSSLGRIHSAEDTIRCAESFRNAGFCNLSLDLMYAIPGQTMQTLSTSVSQVLKLSPQHISCYGLKIEDGTPFGKMLERGELTEMPDDVYADMYEFIRSECASNGYEQYELSNFSKKGFESRHNLKYWLAGEYIGLGTAASSYVSSVRYTHTSDFDDYIKSFKNDEKYSLTTEDMMSEYMFLSLRLTHIGASKSDFSLRFGKKIEDVFGNAIQKHLRLGTLTDAGDRYVLTPEAYYISNSVLCDFV